MYKQLLRAVLAVAAFFIVLPVPANLKKAFEALEVHNYFQARELFRKHTKKRPAIAFYGLSVISGRDNNPFFDPDSAYHFIMRADTAYTRADDRDRKHAAKFGVDHDAIEAQKQHVFESTWATAEAANTVEAYDRYVRSYKGSHRMAEAIERRDRLAFQRAREENTSVAYQYFLNSFPEAKEVYEARSRLQEAIFRESTDEKDLQSYIEFLRRHPDNPYAEQAQDAIYRLSTKDRSEAEYKKFIQEFPDHPRVPDAWRSIYELRTRNLTVNAITQFLLDHPDYPFAEELVQDYSIASRQLFPFRKGDRWGFVDEQGVERIAASFDWVEPFTGAQALVGLGGKVGTLNKAGQEVIPITYDEVYDPNKDMSPVENDGKMGAVDRNGEPVVPLEFSEVGEFSNGLAYAAKDSLFGYIDQEGNEMIPFQFVSAGTFRNGLAVIGNGGRYGVIDTRGNIVVPPVYEWVEGFETGISRVRLNDHMGTISPFGDELLPLEYDHIGPLNDGLALVVKGRKCGYTDGGGKLVIPMEFSAAEGVANWGDMRNGLAEVEQNGKRCLIDTTGRKVFPCQFADIGPATGELIPFRKRTKWGYADRNGTIIFDNRYDLAWEMIDGLARVKTGALVGMIDTTGIETIPLRFTEVSDPKYGFVVVTDENGKGVMDRSGNVRVPLIYDAVEIVSAEVARVELNDRFGYIRLADGNFIWKEQELELPSTVEEEEEEGEGTE